MMISGRAGLAGVVGWPIAHSRSPQLHGHWLRRYRIDGAYVPMSVLPDRVEQALRALPLLGFRGCNVTVPHKRAALTVADTADAFAMRVGAVNTLTVGVDGALGGSNTDGFGFLESVRTGAPTWRPPAGPALVVGAGGAARAIVAALIDAGVPEIRLANRTLSRGKDLAADLGGPIVPVAWKERSAAADGAALLVNTTTLGMDGQPPLDLELTPLPVAAVVTDIVYTPLMTPLLSDAAARGNPVVDGLGMLLHQAVPGFAAWFGVEPTVDAALRDAVLAG